MLFYGFLNENVSIRQFQQDLVSNGRINTKLLESTTPATPIAVIPTSLNRPIANAIDNDFDYPKRKYPSVLVHYNAEPLDESYTGKPFNGPVSTSTPPPITTYKPVYSSTTTVLPLTSTPSFGISSTTTPTPYYQSPTISPPSKYFLPPSFNQGNNYQSNCQVTLVAAIQKAKRLNTTTNQRDLFVFQAKIHPSYELNRTKHIQRHTPPMLMIELAVNYNRQFCHQLHSMMHQAEII